MSKMWQELCISDKCATPRMGAGTVLIKIWHCGNTLEKSFLWMGEAPSFLAAFSFSGSCSIT